MYKLTAKLAFALLAAVVLVGCGSDPMSSNGSSDQYLPTDNFVSMSTSRGANTASAAATPISATLHLWETYNNNLSIDVYRVTSSWDEMTVTWNSFGGAFTGPVIGSFVADGYGPQMVDVTSLVQGWADGSFPNFGMLLDQDPYNTPRAGWSSREVTNREPYLVVCYDDGSCDTTIAMADTYIREIAPDANYGGGNLLYTGWENETDLEKQTLISFNITPPPPPPGEGCSHTIGYWKTHAGFGPQADEVTQYLPIWLGTPGGSESIQVTTAGMAVNILKMDVYGHQGNGITKLMGQLLGTKLSIADGASDIDVDIAIGEADAFLADHNWQDWNSLGQADKSMVIGWKDTFDAYNNGEIGPGHCDDGGDKDKDRDRCRGDRNGNRHGSRGHDCDNDRNGNRHGNDNNRNGCDNDDNNDRGRGRGRH